MATLYSSRLYQKKGLVGTDTYTVPTGFTAVMRCADMYQDILSGPGNIFLEGALGQAIYWGNSGLNGQEWLQWKGRQVFLEGEVLTISTDSPWDVTIMGYLLTNP